jgi:hypothetical protein
MLERYNFRAAIRDALNRAHQNAKEAKEMLIKESEKNLALREALVNAGADAAINNYYCTERQIAYNIERRINLKEFTPEAAERSERRINRRMFWHRYSLFGHEALAAARRPDLLESAESRRAQAHGNLRCAAFEVALARRMKNDKDTVSRTFTYAQIRQLAKKHKLFNETKAD